MKITQLLTHEDRIIRNLAKEILPEKVSIQFLNTWWVSLQINNIRVCLHQLHKDYWIVYFDDPNKTLYLDRDMDLLVKRLKEFSLKNDS